MPTSPPVSLVSCWFIEPGREAEATAALTRLAGEVLETEPGTLTYLVHSAYQSDQPLQSLPPVDPRSIVFFETYRDADAFLAHVNGPVFTSFVSEHGALFVAANGKPYTTVQFLTTVAGHSRAGSAAPAPNAYAPNAYA
jgi:quinol monooxygenase YgiN